jgi:hypothetical protein
MLITGRYLPGGSGNPATQFRPGKCPNPGGVTKLQMEYESFRDRLFDPECRNAAFTALKQAII